MARGGGKTTSPETNAAGASQLYGTKEEVAGRLEDGYPSTESHFTQIRPASSVAPTKGKSIDDKNGTGQGAHGVVARNGQLGRNIRRGQ
jgi:hypothetical protein